MKKVTTMVLSAMSVLMVAGFAMANEGAPAGDKPAGDKPKKECKKHMSFADADVDKDGKLSKAEFTAMCAGKDAAKVEARFTAADTDKDGFLTKEELKASRQAGKGKDGKGKKHHKGPDAPEATTVPAAQ
ncbi:MAG: hypothetical protein WCO77_11370 [bacterium]